MVAKVAQERDYTHPRSCRDHGAGKGHGTHSSWLKSKVPITRQKKMMVRDEENPWGSNMACDETNMACNKT